MLRFAPNFSLLGNLQGRALALSCLLAAVACRSGEQGAAPARDGALPALPSRDAAVHEAGVHEGAARDAGLADAGAADAAVALGNVARPTFCARPGEDAVRDLFCGPTLPSITSLFALEQRLQVGPVLLPGASTDGSYDASALDPTSLVDVAVFMGHSTALSGHLVSPINPRAIIIGPNAVLTFQRGVQQIEVAAPARDDSGFNFYLLEFEQACTHSERGCKPGDLYTPRIEQDWQRVSVRDDEELKNTTLDCRQCHQRGLDAPILLMRELEGPWTHFFEPFDGGSYESPGLEGRPLVEDYVDAKGDERYGGIGSDIIRHTVGFVLQNIVRSAQPLLFDAPRISEERFPFGPDGYATEPQPSPTWDKAYAAFKRGEQLALPYLAPRPADAQKQARLTEAYKRFRAGTLAADELPDLADIFPDDPMVRAQIGLQTEPGASAADALIQACGSCHNDVLDQTISRARFNIDLARLSPAELALAAERIQKPSSDPGVMPPREGRQLDDEARDKLLAYFRGAMRTAEDDARLKRAAMLGMAGGG